MDHGASPERPRLQLHREGIGETGEAQLRTGCLKCTLSQIDFENEKPLFFPLSRMAVLFPIPLEVPNGDLI